MPDKKSKDYLTKTQRWLVNALLELMDQKEYSRITVKELSEAAEVARATFYLNFRTKDDVLNRYIDTLYVQFREQFVSILDHPEAYELALIYFSFWHDHLDFIRILQKQNLFYLLLERHENWMRDLFGTCNEEKPLTLRFADPRQRDFFAVYQSGGMWNLLKRWVESGAKESPEYLSRVFAEIQAERVQF